MKNQLFKILVVKFGLDINNMSQIFHFGNGTFSSELWIANKRVFANLKEVNVEFLSGDLWDWVINDASGNLVKIVRHHGLSGWTSIDLPSLGLYGAFSIGFRNASSSEKIIRGGDVNFETNY